MAIQLKKQRKWLVITAAVLLTATPSFALFGIGDIVFDPTSYASLIQQLTTLQMQYNMVKNNITHFSLKQQWQTTLHKLENANVANMFGETAGIKIALNSNAASTSATAWKTATVSMSSGTSSYLAGQSLGSARISQLAMIETSDSISPDCLTAVGQYRTNRTENSTANSSLLSSQFDISSGTNSEVQQLNLLNAAEAQKLSEMQSQGTLQSCLAGQMTVANMERRNATVEDINTAAFVQQQRSTNNVSAASEKQYLEDLPSVSATHAALVILTAPPLPLRGDDYDFTDAAGPGITGHEFRRGLALPVHQQPDESNHAERRRIDAARIDRAELHCALLADQHGHQLEHLRNDGVALPCAPGARGRSDALSDAAHHLLPAYQLLGESAPRRELWAEITSSAISPKRWLPHSTRVRSTLCFSF